MLPSLEVSVLINPDAFIKSEVHGNGIGDAVKWIRYYLLLV